MFVLSNVPQMKVLETTTLKKLGSRDCFIKSMIGPFSEQRWGFLASLFSSRTSTTLACCVITVQYGAAKPPREDQMTLKLILLRLRSMVDDVSFDSFRLE